MKRFFCGREGWLAIATITLLFLASQNLSQGTSLKPEDIFDIWSFMVPTGTIPGFIVFSLKRSVREAFKIFKVAFWTFTITSLAFLFFVL